MILVQGVTSGGTLAAILPDRERAEEWIEQTERISGRNIAWSLTETQCVTINEALARISTQTMTNKETTT